MPDEKRSEHIGFKTTQAIREKIQEMAKSERRTISDALHLCMEEYFSDDEEERQAS